MHDTTLVRKLGLKYLSILLFWILCLLFVVKIYTDINLENTNILKQYNKRDGQRIVAHFSQNNVFPELQLDTKKKDLANDSLISAIETELPALPFRYWYWNESKPLQTSPNCSQFPNIFSLKLYNKYWQTFEVKNVTFQLYSAHYDDHDEERPIVRLLAMINTTMAQFPKFYCQLWYNHQSQPVLTKVSLSMIWYANWGNSAGMLYPYLLSCLLPSATAAKNIPQVVSLVTNECERANNSLRIVYEQPEPQNTKQQFAVCVKGLDFPNRDISARLVEWIELQRILGAQKIFFYLLEVHPNVSRVLEHYVSMGFVDVRPITLANGVPNTPQLLHYLLKMRPLIKRLNEIIPYNDCFYRNLYKYDYIALEDIDEVFMPLGNYTNWTELVEYAETAAPTADCSDGYASYCLRNVYFPNYSNDTGLLFYPSGVPNYMYMLAHVQRSSEHLGTNSAIKCLHRTKYVLALHNHYALDWRDVCPAWSFPTDVAQLNHYRHEDRKENLTNCVTDMNIWRFKDVLLEHSMKAFREMQFFKEDSYA